MWPVRDTMIEAIGRCVNEDVLFDMQANKIYHKFKFKGFTWALANMHVAKRLIEFQCKDMDTCVTDLWSSLVIISWPVKPFL